jgi:hypothetical protein
MFLPGADIPCIRVFTAGFAGRSIFLLPLTEASLFKIYVYFWSFIQGIWAVSSFHSVVVEVTSVERSILPSIHISYPDGELVLIR